MAGTVPDDDHAGRSEEGGLHDCGIADQPSLKTTERAQNTSPRPNNPETCWERQILVGVRLLASNAEQLADDDGVVGAESRGAWVCGE